MSTHIGTLAASLFLVAGVAFFLAAAIGGFVAQKPVFFSFFGVGAAFLGVGAVFLKKSKGPAA